MCTWCTSHTHTAPRINCFHSAYLFKTMRPMICTVRGLQKANNLVSWNWMRFMEMSYSIHNTQHHVIMNTPNSIPSSCNTCYNIFCSFDASCISIDVDKYQTAYNCIAKNWSDKNNLVRTMKMCHNKCNHFALNFRIEMDSNHKKLFNYRFPNDFQELKNNWQQRSVLSRCFSRDGGRWQNFSDWAQYKW